MHTKQALEIIKQVLDLATEKGIFKTINDSMTIIEAYNVIFKKLNDNEVSNDTNGQHNQ